MTTRKFAGMGFIVLIAGNMFAQQNLGYTNTPVIPGTPWRVHDGARPQPRVVTPGATFSQLAPPPADAIVLFDGKDLSHWESSKGGEAKWKLVSMPSIRRATSKNVTGAAALRALSQSKPSTSSPTVARNDCYMEAVKGAGSIRTKEKFADFQLHLEFATPAIVAGKGQGRGNSGILINGCYEVQVLDSFQNPTYPDGQAGAIYGQTPPLVNACKRPGEWQGYDIIFESPRWNADGKLIKKANVTVIHNGVVLHHKREFIGATDGTGDLPHKALAIYPKPHPPEVFIELQDHNNPVRYRNIWIRSLGEYDQP